MSLDEALALAKDSRVLGKAQKGQSKTLALRFKDTTAMAAFAGEKKLDDVSALGRFKITGFPVTSSVHGLRDFLISSKWELETILFLDEKQAVFLSKNCGSDDPCFFRAGT